MNSKNRAILFPAAVLSLFFFAGSVYAADTVDVLGTAEVVNTGNSLLFEENNSAVTVDMETGNVSGFVWSEDIGWIDFDNNGGDDAVTVDLETGAVTGIAYVVNTAASVDFTGHNSNVTVDVETGEFTGFAWSEDVGWIDFEEVNTAGEPLVLEENFVTVVSVGSETASEDGTWSTSEKRPTISGTTAPNSVVTITITRDGTSVDVVITANEDGNWSWTPSEDLVLGAYTIRIVSENADGVLSESTFTMEILGEDTVVDDLAPSGLSNPYVMIVLTIVGFTIAVVSSRIILRRK